MEKQSVLIYGASRGLGRYFYRRLAGQGYEVIGLSRRRPDWVAADARWLTADLTAPLESLACLRELDLPRLDVLIYNVGIWEPRAFEAGYDFLQDPPEYLVRMVNANVTSCILHCQALIPRLLRADRPRMIFTGSTSALDHTGRREVTFNATKFALRGIAQSLRATLKEQRVAVTCLNPGYLDTDLDAATEEVIARHEGAQIPLSDLGRVLDLVLALSPASCPLEINLPAMTEREV